MAFKGVIRATEEAGETERFSERAEMASDQVRKWGGQLEAAERASEVAERCSKATSEAAWRLSKGGQKNSLCDGTTFHRLQPNRKIRTSCGLQKILMDPTGLLCGCLPHEKIVPPISGPGHTRLDFAFILTLPNVERVLYCLGQKRLSTQLDLLIAQY